MKENCEQFDRDGYYYYNSEGIKYEMIVFGTDINDEAFGFTFIDVSCKFIKDFAILFEDNNSTIILYKDDIDNKLINLYFHIIEYINFKFESSCFYSINKPLLKISLSEALNTNKYLDYINDLNYMPCIEDENN
jgi:hypothetical protein